MGGSGETVCSTVVNDLSIELSLAEASTAGVNGITTRSLADKVGKDASLGCATVKSEL